MDNKKIIGYDAETGEPIYEEVVNVEAPAESAVEETVSEPVVEETVAPAEETIETPVYDTVSEYTEPTVEETADNKKKMGLLIIGIAAALVIAIVVLLIVFVFAKKPRDIVKDACKNTFESFTNGDNLLFTALSPEGFDKSECTVAIDGTFEDTWAEEKASFDVTVSADEDKLQLYGGVDLSEIEGIPYIDGVFEINDSKILLTSSLLHNVFAYDYTKDCDGVIADYLEMADLPASTINEMFSNIFASYSAAVKDPVKYEDYAEVFDDAFKKIEFKKISSEEYEVDGKDRNCKGYKMIITSENVEDFADAYKELISEVMDEDFVEYMESMSGQSIDEIMDEAFEELEDEIDDMDDIEINFYIYNKALAAITCEIEGSEVELAFQGGDYRAQNMTIGADGTKLKISSDIDDGVETLTFKLAKQELFSYEYDSESGDLSFDVMGTKIDGINITSKKGEWKLTLDGFEYDDYKLSGEMVLTDKAKFKDIDGDEVLLNDVTEDELMDIIYSEADLISDFMY